VTAPTDTPSPTPTVTPMFDFGLALIGSNFRPIYTETVSFEVDLTNGGNVTDSFEVWLETSPPQGWVAQYCIEDSCSDYTVPGTQVTLAKGAARALYIKLKAASDAAGGYVQPATLWVQSLGNPAKKKSQSVEVGGHATIQPLKYTIELTRSPTDRVERTTRRTENKHACPNPPRPDAASGRRRVCGLRRLPDSTLTCRHAQFGARLFRARQSRIRGRPVGPGAVRFRQGHRIGCARRGGVQLSRRSVPQKGNLDQAFADQAKALYTTALELDPRSTAAYYHRGDAYRQKGLKAEAIADMESYLKLAPNASNRAQVEGWIRELKGQ